MGLTFRKATSDDLEDIVRIYDRSHDAEEAGFTTTGWKRGIYPVRSVAEASLERGDMYVAELTDEDHPDPWVIATGVINQIQVDVYAECDWIYKGPDDDVSVLHTLAVDPDARGMGAGPAFVRFWEDLAAEEGCSILRIDTNALNKRARRMYAKLGYIESGVVPTVFNGLKNVDLVMMEKFIGTDIQRRLREMQDTKYADFQMALIPGMERERAIGVRTPQLRALAKELYKASQKGDDAAGRELDAFIGTLPHKYFDEMQLHAFVISEIKDFDTCMAEVERFLPHIDNWATCDQLSPKVFRKHRRELLAHIDRWLESEHTYTVRFGMGMLMQHFLDEDFDISYMDRIAEIRSDEYYINMMIAWYFATALAKQPEPALAVLKEQRLAKWTHNKAIQKAIESRRITDEQKEYLRTLKIR
jgi:3-methyladenine DNA glycosylase AlkD/GNAT superfamily N-acetyltransferase